MGRPNIDWFPDPPTCSRSGELFLAGRFQLVRAAGATTFCRWVYKPLYFSVNLMWDYSPGRPNEKTFRVHAVNFVSSSSFLSLVLCLLLYNPPGRRFALCLTRRNLSDTSGATVEQGHCFCMRMVPDAACMFAGGARCLCQTMHFL
jgi:hypothetical protein